MSSEMELGPAATLEGKRRHYRCLRVDTPEGSYRVEYRARPMGNETVHVDGRLASRSHSTWWYVPGFSFQLGSTPALLTARYWPWLAPRSIQLIVGGQVAYAEGIQKTPVSAAELPAVISGNLFPADARPVSYRAVTLPATENIDCHKDESGVTLSRPWFDWLAVAAVPFCLLWMGALALAYTLTLRRAVPAWIVHVMLAPFLVAGIYLAYATIARFVNRTRIHLAPGALVIRHGPLPWPGNRTIPVADVRQLCCKQTANRDYTGDTWVTHTLVATLDDGREIELLSRIGSPAAARFLEKEAGHWLAAAS